ncbi:MAG: peptidase M23 [Firmicutes bacterium]|nr:peptidase M23 [Bacillota bacterium]
MNRFTNTLSNLAKSAGKKLVKSLAKKLFIWLLPCMPIILAVVACILLVGLTYYSMTAQTALTGADPSEQDTEIQQQYMELVDENNVKETWLVPNESTPDNPHYPRKGTDHIGQMVDEYRKDYPLRLTWGVTHSTALYWAYSFNEAEIPDTLREEVAADQRPFFYYKPSQIITTTTDSEGNSSTSTRDIHLLVEANTIYGWYQYHYKWKTFRYGDTTVKKEVLDTTHTLAKWERLESYLKELYQVPNDPDAEFTRTAVLEAGRGFNEKKEWLDWLIENIGYSFVSSSTVPAGLIQFFREAENEFGIPWWFLAAVAFKESSFNIQAENASTGCFGLMGVSPNNWDAYAPRLGFDAGLDRENTRAQIFVGAYMLQNYGLNRINWDNNWQQSTLPALKQYGGFRTLPLGKKMLYENVDEWCKVEYAQPIWEIAENLKQETLSGIWPTPEYYNISSPFGWRKDPINSTPNELHTGMDIAAPMGSDVVSVSSGIVTSSGWANPNNHNESYGLRITVRDGIHLYVYAHLQEGSLRVKVGDIVEPGQHFANVGSTGKSTGPHLHIGIKEDGRWIDPLDILSME